MLPFFPEVSRVAGEDTRELLRTIALKLSIISGVEMHIQHEGERQSISRHDGTEGSVVMRPIELSDVFERDQLLEDFNRKEIARRLLKLAEQLARGQSETAMEAMREATEATGNVVDAEDGPLTPELLLKVLDTMAHSFDDDGKWNPPSIILSPEMMKRIRENFTPESEAKYKSQFDAVIMRKREEHFAREAGRVLAG